MPAPTIPTPVPPTAPVGSGSGGRTAVAGQAAIRARTSGRTALQEALIDSRTRTLALFQAYQHGLADSALAVPQREELNPPCWELGHVGWFQEWWLGRFSERHAGPGANPCAPRTPSRLPGADQWYHSGQVAHANRWQLPLPGPDATLAYVQDTLTETLILLANAPEDDTGLYLYRLAVFHEDMHAEAAVYMAQTLGLALPETLQGRWPVPAEGVQVDHAAASASTPDRPVATLPGGPLQLGAHGPGFWFDNECRGHPVHLMPFDVDLQPVTWSDYLPFVEAGGYSQPQWWCQQGLAWLGNTADRSGNLPRHTRSTPNGGWEVCRFGQWQALNPAEPAVHLTWYEAQAWCRWANRRLPTEAEWEYAALHEPDFRWGQVWEWTASTFLPYAGFQAHPYADYSQPWFGSRIVLRGASTATHPRMAHPKYRNFFPPWRNDIHAGFRSCATR